MSDEKIRDLERRLREGDLGARVLLTFERVRARQGILLVWDVPVEGSVMIWARRIDRYKRESTGVARAVAVLDLQGFFETTFRHVGLVANMLDLETGRVIGGGYARVGKVLEVSLSPPKGSKLRGGVCEEPRRRVRRGRCTAITGGFRCGRSVRHKGQHGIGRYTHQDALDAQAAIDETS